MTTTCPWCSAPRDTGDECPRCGANYAKAEAIKSHGRATPTAEPLDSPATSTDSVVLTHAGESVEWQPVSDAELEWKFCIAAIPLALCAAMLVHASGMGAMLQRIFLTMPVHEFGHAVTAWFCGYAAVPALWKTLIPETRGFIAPLALTGAIGYLMFRGYQSQQLHRLPLLYAGGALLLLQFTGTFIIKPDRANLLITFGGDGMGMILATLLMASFFFGKHTQLYKGSLRWGFVVIGAVAFVDIYATWWKARKDDNAIPYGTMDGMASDSMKLVEMHGWTLQTLVQRYVVLGVCCLIMLALVYAWGVWQAKSALEARRLAEKKAQWTQREQWGKRGKPGPPGPADH